MRKEGTGATKPGRERKTKNIVTSAGKWKYMFAIIIKTHNTIEFFKNKNI